MRRLRTSLTFPRLLIPSLLGLLSLQACAPPEAPTAQAHAIVNGTREMGEEAVVLISTFGGAGGLCTGTLIAPRVVLTAKHCVQAPDAPNPYRPAVLTVGVGHARGATRNYAAAHVLATEGAFTSSPTSGLGGALFGLDVGVIVLAEAVEDVTPIEIMREAPLDLIGERFTAVGFGSRPGDEPAGLKYKGEGEITGLQNGILYTAMTICSGDSGGPMILEGPIRRVIGVASFGEAQACPSTREGYNTIHEQVGLIDQAMLLADSCLSAEAEICNSIDDNCDGQVDEGCAAVGESCEADTDCAHAQLPDFLEPLTAPVRCEDLGEGGVCTLDCNPLMPAQGCGEISLFMGQTSELDGLYCQRINGCEGRCAPGSAGEKVDGDECAQDIECLSLNCADPGDGRMRCLPLCRSGEGTCPLEEACVAPAGECGSCVEASLLTAARQLGEVCQEDGDCAEGQCETTAEYAYCTRACEDDAGCPEAFRCEETQCLRGRRAVTGEPCAGNGDCSAGNFCASQGERGWCTETCNLDIGCAAGLSCVDAGGANLCAPDLALIGEACVQGVECGSGQCSASGVCTADCGAGAACTPGYLCRRDDDGMSRCLPPPAPEVATGCSMALSGQKSSGLMLITMLGLGLLIRRRRSRG